MIKRVQKVSRVSTTDSYKNQKQKQNPRKNSSLNGDFSKIFEQELKKLR